MGLNTSTTTAGGGMATAFQGRRLLDSPFSPSEDSPSLLSGSLTDDTSPFFPIFDYSSISLPSQMKTTRDSENLNTKKVNPSTSNISDSNSGNTNGGLPNSAIYSGHTHGFGSHNASSTPFYNDEECSFSHRFSNDTNAQNINTNGSSLSSSVSPSVASAPRGVLGHSPLAFRAGSSSPSCLNVNQHKVGIDNQHWHQQHLLQQQQHYNISVSAGSGTISRPSRTSSVAIPTSSSTGSLTSTATVASNDSEMASMLPPPFPQHAFDNQYQTSFNRHERRTYSASLTIGLSRGHTHVETHDSAPNPALSTFVSPSFNGTHSTSSNSGRSQPTTSMSDTNLIRHHQFHYQMKRMGESPKYIDQSATIHKASNCTNQNGAAYISPYHLAGTAHTWGDTDSNALLNEQFQRQQIPYEMQHRQQHYHESTMDDDEQLFASQLIGAGSVVLEGSDHGVSGDCQVSQWPFSTRSPYGGFDTDNENGGGVYDESGLNNIDREASRLVPSELLQDAVGDATVVGDNIGVPSSAFHLADADDDELHGDGGLVMKMSAVSLKHIGSEPQKAVDMPLDQKGHDGYSQMRRMDRLLENNVDDLTKSPADNHAKLMGGYLTGSSLASSSDTNASIGFGGILQSSGNGRRRWSEYRQSSSDSSNSLSIALSSKASQHGSSYSQLRPFDLQWGPPNLDELNHTDSAKMISESLANLTGGSVATMYQTRSKSSASVGPSLVSPTSSSLSVSELAMSACSESAATNSSAAAPMVATAAESATGAAEFQNNRNHVDNSGTSNGTSAPVLSSVQPQCRISHQSEMVPALDLPIVREIQTSKLKVDDKKLTKEYFESLTLEAMDIVKEITPSEEELQRQRLVFQIVSEIVRGVFHGN
jgi:hypothetical protein